MNAAGRIILLAGGGLAIYAAFKNRAQIGQALSPVVNLLPGVDPSQLTPVCRNEAGDVVPCASPSPVPTPKPIVPAPAPDPISQVTGAAIAWGAKVSSIFRDRVRWIAQQLGFDPSWLMAAMYFESGGTFSSSITNPASGAGGLIQFLERTANNLGTTLAIMLGMNPADQLNYVYKYLAPYAGRLKTPADLYMAILYPAAIGQPDSFVLFRRGTLAYTQNAALDLNKDGVITKGEAVAPVLARLSQGLQPGNMA